MITHSNPFRSSHSVTRDIAWQLRAAQIRHLLAHRMKIRIATPCLTRLPPAINATLTRNSSLMGLACYARLRLMGVRNAQSRIKNWSARPALMELRVSSIQHKIMHSIHYRIVAFNVPWHVVSALLIHIANPVGMVMYFRQSGVLLAPWLIANFVPIPPM